MNKTERKRKLHHLLDVKDSIAYLQERVRLADGSDRPIIEKNLRYALQKEEALCKQIGFGDSTNSSTTSQRLEGKV
jgi:hypothetical protein